MSISKEKVAYIASLARLTLTENEANEYTTQLSDILQFAEKLNELDTENIAPTSHAFSLTNVLREDTVKPSLPREEALKNAPRSAQGMFEVPGVFKE